MFLHHPPIRLITQLIRSVMMQYEAESRAIRCIRCIYQRYQIVFSYGASSCIRIIFVAVFVTIPGTSNQLGKGVDCENGAGHRCSAIVAFHPLYEYLSSVSY